MTWWFIAAFAALPLVLTNDRPQQSWVKHLLHARKFRTWCVLVTVCLAFQAVPLTYREVALLIVVNLAAGVIVMIRPAGMFQAVIACIFLGSTGYHLGFIMAGQPQNLGLYEFGRQGLFWGQLGCLVVWGIYDAARRFDPNHWPYRDDHSGVVDRV